jgi:protein involved in polysaccharide export with SLBB domain
MRVGREGTLRPVEWARGLGVSQLWRWTSARISGLVERMGLRFREDDEQHQRNLITRRRAAALAAACFALTALAGCGQGPMTTATSSDMQAAAREPYRLGPGDKVRVTVYGEQELSGEFDLDGGGIVALPLVGPVHVGGATIADASANVAAAYRKGYLKDPQVSIQVLNYRPFYILGEVRNPGSYPYVNGMTVLNAVALAGGFTYRAAEGSFVIVRANDPSKAEQRVPPETGVLPGDIVKVQERYF